MTDVEAIVGPKIPEGVQTFPGGHFSQKGMFSVDHLVVGECLDKMLCISVNHAKSQMVVMIASVNRVFFHIGQGVVHPAHVPFHMKAQTLTLRLPGDTRPGSGFLRDHHGSGSKLPGRPV